MTTEPPSYTTSRDVTTAPTHIAMQKVHKWSFGLVVGLKRGEMVFNRSESLTSWQTSVTLARER